MMGAKRTEDDPRWALIPMGVAAALVAVILVRFGGLWTENDTAVLARAARGVLDQGVLAPVGASYDHGFAFPVLLATLSGVVGLPIATVQMTVLPWYLVVSTLATFVAVRAVTGSGRAGAVGAMLLLVQSDFLFVSQRGSHEKTTWTLVLIMLCVLVRSFRTRGPRDSAPLVVVFYLCGFALLCTNAFFGSSLTTVIALTACGTFVAGRWLLPFPRGRRLAPRLGYAFLTLGLLTYLVMGVLYPPARSTVGSTARAADRLASLYLNVETQVEAGVSEAASAASSATVSRSRATVSPYQTISAGWTSPQVFFALTSFTWLLIAAGAFSWLVLAITFVRRKVSEPETPVFIVWGLAAAAAVQVAASVASDFAGVLGSNLQLRLFPFFAVFTVPVVVATAFGYRLPVRSKVLRWSGAGALAVATPAVAVVSPEVVVVAAPLVLAGIVIHLNWHKSRLARSAGAALGTAAFVFFAVAAFFKAMNDPLVSTKWTFYTEAEARALVWGNQALDDRLVWSDYDERLQVASIMLNPGDVARPSTAIWTRGESFTGRYLLLTDVNRARALRLRALSPSTEGMDRIYDNGSAQVFHRVPTTPYQP